MIAFALLTLFALVAFGVQVFGVVVSFKKSALWGIISLLVPGFALVIGGLKIFKVEVLK